MINTSIERNDVDISRLFTWRKEFSIVDKSGEEIQKVYIRLAGDADVNQARVFALRKSAEFRKKLKDPDSDERFAFIPEKDFIKKENLAESLLLFIVREITIDAYKKIKVDEPKEPDSESTLEQQEEYQKLVDAYPDKVKEAIKEYVEGETDKRRKEYGERTFNSLYEELENSIISQQCENEMYYRFKEMCVFLGTYKDEEYIERLFKNFDEFDNLPTNIKDQFMSHYNSIEMSTEELKN